MQTLFIGLEKVMYNFNNFIKSLYLEFALLIFSNYVHIQPIPICVIFSMLLILKLYCLGKSKMSLINYSFIIINKIVMLIIFVLDC